MGNADRDQIVRLRDKPSTSVAEGQAITALLDRLDSAERLLAEAQEVCSTVVGCDDDHTVRHAKVYPPSASGVAVYLQDHAKTLAARIAAHLEDGHV